jgi:hypothetical protein
MGGEVKRLILALLLALIASPSSADITSNLVSHWTFNVDGTASVGTNATLTNGASVTASSTIGAGALLCDGTNDFANCSTIASSDAAAALTYAMWVYPTALGDSDQIFTKFVSTSSRAGLELGSGSTGSNNDLVVFVSTGSTKSGYTNANVLSTNTWAHVAVVYNGGGATDADKLKIYVNGSEQTVTVPSAGLPTTMMNTPTQEWWAGWRDDSPAGFAWNGRIDDLRVYTRALSAGDITELYNYRESSGIAPKARYYYENSAVERDRKQFYAALKLAIPSWGLSP